MIRSGDDGQPVYSEHPPHPALRRHVECYWTIHARGATGETQLASVLPDGCMDIIFDLVDGASVLPVAVGTMTRPLEVRRGGHECLLGVRFRPGAATPFMPGEAHVLTDASTTLDGLWGSVAVEIHERLFEAGKPTERLAVLDLVLLHRLGLWGHDVDEAVLQAAELAARSRGSASVEAMAEAAGLGRRQLERRFLDAVGIPPKVMARVLRFRHAVTLMQSSPGDDLSRVAFAAGYADQPHFSREFRALADTTPGRYRGPARFLSGRRSGGPPDHDAFVQSPSVDVAYLHRPCPSHPAPSTAKETPAVKKATPLITVERIESCLPFWTDALGFETTVSVPHDEHLGFAILVRGDVEIMYQSRASIDADLGGSAATADLGRELEASTSTLFVEVEDLDEVIRALGESADVVVPRRQTFYGMDEIFLRAPCGTLVGFAAKVETAS